MEKIRSLVVFLTEIIVIKSRKMMSELYGREGKCIPVFICKLERKRPTGRVMLRFEDNIKTYLK
jgi:hypothetical protein